MALRFYDKGSTFGVTVGEREVAEFKSRWPASWLGRGPYFFEYDKRSGDLVNVKGALERWGVDGLPLLALSDDARLYGRCRMAKRGGAGPCRRAFVRRWGGR